MLVNLSKVSDVKSFIAVSQSCTNDLVLKSTDGKYTVDAKSILGIFSLDLSKPVEIVGCEADLKKFTAFC